MRTQLTALRRAMEQHHVDYYLIPTADFHGSEYVGDYFKCRAYVSGFTGSAGTLLVGKDWAGLWTDGRYFLQAGQQLKDTGIELCKSGQPGVPTIPDYLKEHLTDGQTLGFDGRVVSADAYHDYQKALEGKAVTLNGQLDLVGEIWTDRPALSAQPVWELSTEYTGQSREERLSNLRTAVKEAGADTFVLTSLDDIAWLLNIRGDDVACNPVVLSYLTMTAEETTLYINPQTLPETLKEALKADGVTIAPYNDVYGFVANLSAGTTLLLDEAKANAAILAAVPEGVKVIDKPSPTELPKAVKNPTEVAHMRQAHVKDGVAVTKFMYWLKKNVGKLPMTELSVADKLEAFRGEQEHYLGPSFDPIMGYGPHGAIIHYSATPESDIPLEPRSFLLADTGGQYLEGTTDITRTFVLGPVTEEEKKGFTLVLKSHLDLAGAVFRKGATGMHLDVIARMPFWKMEMDYNHGTGHGVGYLLNVHEGPQSIGWNRKNTTPMEVGMITSNEPGLYLEGKFGVRHENLVVCVEGSKNEYGQFLKFDDLTLVPFDLDAVEPAMLTQEERNQLNSYHRRVRETLIPYLTEEEGKWLKHATRDI